MSNIRRNFFDRRAGCLAPVAEQAAVAARQRRRRGVGAARRAVLGKVADDVAQDSSILDRFGAWLRAAIGRVPNGDHLATRDVDAVEGELATMDAHGNAEGSGYIIQEGPVGGTVPSRTGLGQLVAHGFMATGWEGIGSSEFVWSINNLTGVHSFHGPAEAANRNAQLKELFRSLPTSDPAVAGELWNDAGAVKISTG